MKRHYDTRDLTDRHEWDQFLRVNGYRIASRPGPGEPVWERDGILYLQSALIEAFMRGAMEGANVLPQEVTC